MLVAPVRDLPRANNHVAILCDGVLSGLNFETLLVPESAQGSVGRGTQHYWIEDVNVSSAPSLEMLASAPGSLSTGRRLLLLGDVLPAGPDYPSLRNAAEEVDEIRRHFKPQDQTIFTRQKATALSYIGSRPAQFDYIDFVAHGVASSADPLDSAIILSPSGDSEDSFKLYARQVILHPIHARVVTISSCYGSGTRAYAGEGLVGLSWAFLRAGAHNVIGALWEVSDASTPRLMNAFYEGLQQGMEPSEALRQAKLTLLHAQGSIRRPFFWAPFELYTGL
jgi:CHAT domain-containing protein